MEVHQHSHTSDPDIHRGRKKWTHYFWEFLMLFLAVFCGFLAEYQLEHTIEHQREVQYMESLYEDLCTDTAEIDGTYALGMQQKDAMDSVINFLNTQSIKGNNVLHLYQLLPATGRVVKVPFENRTSSQLKNSGAMRMIRKKDVSDLIVRYWQLTDICNYISDRLEKLGDNRQNVGMRLFDNKYYLRSSVLFQPVAGVKDNAMLIFNDPALLAEYSNRTYAVSVVLNNYLASMQMAKQKAVSLIALIKKDYNLK